MSLRKPSAERVRALLDYDRDTGIFRWKDTKAQRIKNGEIAGCAVRCARRNVVYWKINVDGMPRSAHVLAWLYCYGEYVAEIDHRDGDGLNNKIENLRPCTATQNRANTGRLITNKSGFKGVSWHNGARKWRATINKDRQQYHLGFFENPEEAYAAYVKSAKEMFGEFARFS